MPRQSSWFIHFTTPDHAFGDHCNGVDHCDGGDHCDDVDGDVDNVDNEHLSVYQQPQLQEQR